MEKCLNEKNLTESMSVYKLSIGDEGKQEDTEQRFKAK